MYSKLVQKYYIDVCIYMTNKFCNTNNNPILYYILFLIQNKKSLKIYINASCYFRLFFYLYFIWSIKIVVYSLRSPGGQRETDDQTLERDGASFNCTGAFTWLNHNAVFEEILSWLKRSVRKIRAEPDKSDQYCILDFLLRYTGIDL